MIIILYRCFYTSLNINWSYMMKITWLDYFVECPKYLNVPQNPTKTNTIGFYWSFNSCSNCETKMFQQEIALRNTENTVCKIVESCWNKIETKIILPLSIKDPPHMNYIYDHITYMTIIMLVSSYGTTIYEEQEREIKLLPETHSRKVD
jgi:hypothetical protein